MSEPPAEILRRLRPIPTYTGRPATRPHDVTGVDPDGTPGTLVVEGAAEPALLLFLSAGCLGCRDLWEGLGELQEGLGGRCRLAVVTKDPGEEDPDAIATLADGAPARLGVPLLMSTPAFRDYRVGGAPFLVLVDGGAVLTEGVAWGIGETLRTTLDALPEGAG